MKFKQLLLCAITIALPLSVNAAAKKDNDRWFEIEVILFSQLGDKSQLKEAFPDGSELPSYRRTTDLLAKYLNPDIASLKQLIPSCDSPQYPADLVSQNAKLPAIFTEKSLAEISQLPSLSASLLPEAQLPESSVTLNGLTNTTDNVTGSTTSLEAMPGTISQTLKNALTTELSDEERAEIQALVLAAEAEFTHLKFPYTQKSAAKAVSKYAEKIMCRIDEKHFADIKADDPSFSYNGFTVNKVPVRVHAAEDLNNNQTHLLARASLKLGDVINDLRYSKNFRPLLHMGWRQVARPRKQSVPVKVYAGDNFAADYQKKLAQYQTDLQQLSKEQAEQTQRFSDTSANTNQAMLLAQAKKARITGIVEQISTVTDNTELLLKAIETEDLSLEVSDNITAHNNNILAPTPPVQDWFIDGLFNVHLKHYLFITADFTILDKNLAELATAQLTNSAQKSAKNNIFEDSAITASNTPAKAIRFKQNRRVISGEVHYFDHPYMGMIVQIRPYKKPKPEEDK